MSKYIVLSKQSCNISSFLDFLKSTIKSNHKKHFEANQLSNYRLIRVQCHEDVGTCMRGLAEIPWIMM